MAVQFKFPSSKRVVFVIVVLFVTLFNDAGMVTAV